MKTLAELWTSYRAILPRDAGPTQVRETKRAFYAGCQALLYSVTAGLSEGPEVGDDDVHALERLDRELREFAASVGGERE